MSQTYRKDRAMQCPQCHTELPDGTSFCTSCGTPLKQDDTSAQATTQMAPQPSAASAQTTTQMAPQVQSVPAAMPVNYVGQAGTAEQAAKKPKKKKTIVILAIVAVVLVATAITLVFVFLNQPKKSEPAQVSKPEAVQQETTEPEESVTTNSNVDADVQGYATEDGYATQSVAGDKTKITNTEHGFSITVPSNYQISSGDIGNSIQIYDAADDMHISVSCLNNTDHKSVQQCYDDLARSHSVSYQFIGSDYCVASYEENGTVYYDKCLVGNGSVVTVRFYYPKTNEGTCDKLLEEIIKTVEQGDLSTTHSI